MSMNLTLLPLKAYNMLCIWSQVLAEFESSIFDEVYKF